MTTWDDRDIPLYTCYINGGTGMTALNGQPEMSKTHQQLKTTRLDPGDDIHTNVDDSSAQKQHNSGKRTLFPAPMLLNFYKQCPQFCLHQDNRSQDLYHCGLRRGSGNVAHNATVFLQKAPTGLASMTVGDKTATAKVMNRRSRRS